MGKINLCLALTLLIPLSVNGQHIVPGYQDADPSWLEQLLFRGEEWRPYLTPVSGHEFFLSDEYLEASLMVDGFSFPNQKIRYDIHRGQIVILWKNNHALVINSSDVDAFSINAGPVRKNFINLREDYRGISGFAEIIYHGNSIVAAQYTKAISKNASLSVYAQFKEYTKYYFITGKVALPVRNRAVFLDMLGVHKNDVKRYIRQNHIIVSRLSPEGFGMAAAYYDSLVKGEEMKN